MQSLNPTETMMRTYIILIVLSFTLGLAVGSFLDLDRNYEKGYNQCEHDKEMAEKEKLIKKMQESIDSLYN